MILSIEIAYDDLLHTGRRRRSGADLVRGTVTVLVPAEPATEFRQVATVREIGTGRVDLLMRDGRPWIRLPEEYGGSSSGRERLEHSLHRRLLDLGLVHPRREALDASDPDPRRWEQHVGRLGWISAIAQEWVRANLATVDGAVVERAAAMPASTVEDPHPSTRAFRIVPASMPDAPVSLRASTTLVRDREALASFLSRTAYRQLPEARRSEGDVLAVLPKFVRAMAEALESTGADDVDTAMRDLADAAGALKSAPPVMLDDIDHSEPVVTLQMPFRPYAPGERFGPKLGTGERDGTVIKQVRVPLVPLPMLPAAYCPDQRSVFHGAVHDGTRFYARSTLFHDRKDPWRVGATSTKQPADFYLWHALAVIRHANILGPARRSYLKLSPLAFGEAVRLDPWRAGNAPELTEIAAMMEEFFERRVVEAKNGELLFRLPEPILRVDCRPGGRPSLLYCYSWRRDAAARPATGGTPPFLFPLTAYDEAVTFLQSFGRPVRRKVWHPTVYPGAPFSADFDAWNLKAALLHVLGCVDGLLPLLPRGAIEAGVRVAKLLDLWCVDTATAATLQPATFMYDCRTLLVGIDDLLPPIVGPQALVRYASGLIDKLAPEQVEPYACGSDDAVDLQIFSM